MKIKKPRIHYIILFFLMILDLEFLNLVDIARFNILGVYYSDIVLPIYISESLIQSMIATHVVPQYLPKKIGYMIVVPTLLRNTQSLKRTKQQITTHPYLFSNHSESIFRFCSPDLSVFLRSPHL